MQKRQNTNLIYYLCLLIIILFFGCTVEQTHKTLVFFFDGVDKVIFFNDDLSHRDSLSKVSESKREALLRKNRPIPCTHQPYKEKKCEACHTPDKRLVMPMPGLCFKCHTNFSEKYPVVHGPVASGGCLNCHNQHSSKYPKLLIRQGQQICLFCHSSAMVFSGKVHRDIEDADCTLCHNPHGGESRYMIRANVAKDISRLALMNEITYRHLYGQIYCKSPGDINTLSEVYILDSRGAIVATAHPDRNGKFYLSNLHPDQSYTFRFKVDVPYCKINITDAAGNLLYEINKDRKGTYNFDKNAYEIVHNAINDAHTAGDTQVAAYLENSNITPPTPQVIAEKNRKDSIDKAIQENIAGANGSATAQTSGAGTGEKGQVGTATNQADTAYRGKIVVRTLSDTEQIPAFTNRVDGKVSAGSVASDTAVYKGKIMVRAMSDTEKIEGYTTDKTNPAVTNETRTADTTTYKGKIVVKELTQEEQITQQEINKADKVKVSNGAGFTDTGGYKGKIIVKSYSEKVMEDEHGIILPKTGADAKEIVRRYARLGISMTSLASQFSRYYDGTIVCVLNDHGNLIDISQVNMFGEFMIYDFLSYKMALPDKSKGIFAQTIFLDDDMNIIETINRRVVGGRYVFVENSTEPAGNKADVMILSNHENAALLTTLIFNNQDAVIAPESKTSLEKMTHYLVTNRKAIAYMVIPPVVGPEKSGRKVTDQRVQAITNFIISKGIRKNRVKILDAGARKIELEPGAENILERNNKIEIYIKNN